MQLRHHPLMTYRTIRNWPPVWTRGTEINKKLANGEIGTLRRVHDVNPASNKIYLVMEHEKEYYVGTLIFGDIRFRHQITKLLQQHIGHEIEEIGNLDVSGTL